MTKRGFRSRSLWLAAALLTVPAAAAAEPVAVSAEPVPLIESRPDVEKIDAMTYRGGLVLGSDHHGFGGLSGLALSRDGGRLLAVTDLGYLFSMTPVIDAEGRLTSVTDVSVAPLMGQEGRRLTGIKTAADAEAMTMTAEGALVVAFEHDHRLLIYDPDGTAPPRAIPLPPEIALASPNGGIEGLTVLPDGRFFILTESLATGPETVAGWVGGEDGWAMFFYRRHDDFRPTGATATANGDIIVVERRFGLLSGQDTRIRRIAAGDLKQAEIVDSKILGELRVPLLVDNFEGIVADPNAVDGPSLFLVSDDNFNPLQRTLLVKFGLEADMSAERQ